MNTRKSYIERASRFIKRKTKVFLAERALISLIKQKQHHPKAYVFGSPGHSNMGDQAQTYCIEKWINTNYKEHQVIIFTYQTATDKVIKAIRTNIGSNDLLFCHSGYHLTDLYNTKKVYCKIAQTFPDYKILIFPQTINFIKNKEEEKMVANIFNAHGNITLLCRDEYSYQLGQKLFTGCKLLLYPDIVTSLIGSLQYFQKRNGILFCMRNDVEAFYKPEEITKLRNRFTPIPTEVTDTTINVSYNIIKKHREKILFDMFEQFSQYKVVITDRYHGTIFSLIAGTPVIVISSSDHKLSSGVKWFPEDFKDYVQYAPDLETAYQMAYSKLKIEDMKYHLPSYFNEHYYSILKDKIEL